MAFDDTATVSGSVVSFSNGADGVPLKNWLVTLPASLDGYTEVNGVRTGKNLLNVNAITNTTNPNNATIVNNGNGTITVTTTTQQNVKTAQKLKDICPNVKIGETYFLNATTTGTQKIIYLHQAAVSWTYGTAKAITSQMLESDVSLYASGTNSTATISDLSLTYGSTATAYEAYTAPTQYTATLGRTIYGGTADIVTGEGEDENGNDFTFEPVTIETSKGSNTFWSEQGSTELTYYKSGYGFTSVTVNKTGKNLFNKNAVEQHTWIIVDNTETETRSNINYLTSDYIPVCANTRYYVSAKSSNRAAYYDRNKNGIAYFSFSGGASFNCLYNGYIRLTIKDNTDLDTFIVNKGSEAIPYEPFGVSKTAKLHKVIYGGTADVIRGTCEPKNLIELYTRASHNGVNYSINADGSLHREGTASPSTSYNNRNAATYSACPYKLSKGTYTITVSGNQASGGYLSLGMRKTDDTQLTSIAVTGNTSKTFTVDEDVGAWYWISLPNGVSANDDIYVQLEKGSESTEHAPYFEPFTFPPISMETDEGENTLFANEGDSAITYRKAVD